MTIIMYGKPFVLKLLCVHLQNRLNYDDRNQFDCNKKSTRL